MKLLLPSGQKLAIVLGPSLKEYCSANIEVVELSGQENIQHQMGKAKLETMEKRTFEFALADS